MQPTSRKSLRWRESAQLGIDLDRKISDPLLGQPRNCRDWRLPSNMACTIPFEAMRVLPR